MLPRILALLGGTSLTIWALTSDTTWFRIAGTIAGAALIITAAVTLYRENKRQAERHQWQKATR